MTRNSMRSVAAHTGSLIQGMGILLLRDYTGSVLIGERSSLRLHLPEDPSIQVTGLNVENWVINIVFLLVGLCAVFFNSLKKFHSLMAILM